MHLTLAFWLPGLLASGALASGIQRRDLETAQNCLASIQSAEEAMDAAIMNLSVGSVQGTDDFPRLIQGVEDAMSLAALTMQSAQPLTAGDSQAFLGSVGSLSSSLRLMAMSLAVQQPTLVTLGLAPVAVQSLIVQRQLVAQLQQTVVTRVAVTVAPVVQVGFGHGISAIDIGLAMLRGGGPRFAVGGGVQTINPGQLAQQCAAAGFIQVEQCAQVPPQQQGLEQQCAAAGLVRAGDAQQDGEQVDQQDAINQCAAIGFVENQATAGEPAEEVQQLSRRNQVVEQQPARGNSTQGDLVQQCAAVGFVERGQGQAQFEASPEACAGLGLIAAEQNQDVAQQCTALGLQPGENAATELPQQQAPEEQEQGVEAGAQDQEEQGQGQVSLEECLALGFVQVDQANETVPAEEAASAEATTPAEETTLAEEVAPEATSTTEEVGATAAVEAEAPALLQRRRGSGRWRA